MTTPGGGGSISRVDASKTVAAASEIFAEQMKGDFMPGTRGRSGGSNKLAESIRIARGTGKTEPTLASQLRSELKRPKFKSRHARDLWNSVAEDLQQAGVVKSIDAALLQCTCELWGLYREAFDRASADPTDKDCRLAVASYFSKFEQCCARFGLNPADRSRLKVDKPETSGVRTRKHS